jgi:hypothetical protein
MVAGDTFLEKDNATLADRGIYVWNGAAVPATRDPSADNGAELFGGMIIRVKEGTVNADTNWQVTNDGVVTIGVTGLTFQKVGASAVITAESDPTFVDDSASAASTSWIRGAMSAIATAAGFSASLTTNGYIKFPSWLGGLVAQWATGATDPATVTEPVQTITLPIAFPTGILNAFASTNIAAASAGVDCWYQIYASSKSSISVQRQAAPSAGINQTTTPRVFAIGY